MIGITKNLHIGEELFEQRVFENHLFVDVDFVKCKFTDVIFVNCKFVNVFWDMCDIINVSFFNNKFVNSNFGLTWMESCKFRDNVHNDGLFTCSIDAGIDYDVFKVIVFDVGCCFYICLW